MSHDESNRANWTPEQLALGKRWVETWKLAGTELERIRRHELRQLDTFRAIELLCGTADYTLPPRAPMPSLTRADRLWRSMDSVSSSKVFPGFDHLYKMCDPFDRAAYRGRATTDDPLALTHGDLQVLQPVFVTHATGGWKTKDLIWTTYVAVVIVSERVVDLLTSNGFTGWKIYPVKVLDKFGNDLTGYVGLSVVGRCGPFLDERSGRTMKQFPARMREVRVGRFFDESTWDGSDFCMSTNNYGFIFVHERVKECFERSHVTNVEFKRMDLIEWD